MDDRVTGAVCELRSRLNDTLTAFGSRLGVTARAVLNYESGRTPSRKILWALALVADREGYEDLYKIFSTSYNLTVGHLTGSVSEEEAAWSRMIVVILRNRDHVPELKDLEKNLFEVAERLSSLPRKRTIAIGTAEFESALQWFRRAIRPTARERLEAAARDRCRSSGEPFGEAFSKVLLDHPELYAQYQQEKQSAVPSKKEKRTKKR